MSKSNISKTSKEIPVLFSISFRYHFVDDIYKGYFIVNDETGVPIEFISIKPEIKTKNVVDESYLIEQGLHWDIPMPIAYRRIPDGIYKEKISRKEYRFHEEGYIIVKYRNEVREGEADHYTKNDILQGSDLYHQGYLVKRYSFHIQNNVLFPFIVLISLYQNGWLSKYIRPKNGKEDGNGMIENFYHGVPEGYQEEIVDGKRVSYFEVRNGCLVNDFDFVWSFTDNIVLSRVKGTFRKTKCLPLGSLDPIYEFVDIIKDILSSNDYDSFLEGVLEITLWRSNEFEDDPQMDEKELRNLCERLSSEGICTRINKKWTIRRYYRYGMEIPFEDYLEEMAELTEAEIGQGRKFPQIGKEISLYL